MRSAAALICVVIVCGVRLLALSAVEGEADQSRLPAFARAALRRPAVAFGEGGKPAPPGGQTEQLVVTEAAPDPSGQTITIKGANFGSRPFVTLDMVPLPVQYAIETQIVASAPIALMPPGEYLVTVSRGPAAADSASIPIALNRGLSPAASPPPPTPDLKVGPTSDSGFGAPTTPAARVGDRVITIDQVDREWQRTDPVGYLSIRRELFDARRRAADRIVADELLAGEAARRGVTVDALLKEEIPKRIVEMPESAVQSLYASLGDTTRGASLEQMRPAIRAWLRRNTEPELAKMNYVEELTRVSTRAEVLLTAPRIPVEHAAQDAVLGPASAPIEIVVFGDFQSAPYVKFAQAFSRVRDTYGDRIRLVFKHLPVAGPDSMAAAEAAQCANEKGRFWPFHDALIAQESPIGITRLQQAAAKAGLDRTAFDACVERGESRGIVRQALDEAARYDIRQPASFLVNGRLVAEPPAFLPPFEFFQRIIEEELLALGKKR
jgi:protein-disulfide isomerase